MRESFWWKDHKAFIWSWEGISSWPCSYIYQASTLNTNKHQSHTDMRAICADLFTCVTSFSLVFAQHRCNDRCSPGVSLSSFSRDYRTGRDEDEGQELIMAARSMLRSVWTSFAGLKVGATCPMVKVQQRIIVPQLPALTVQSRGIRQGETSPQKLRFNPAMLQELA